MIELSNVSTNKAVYFASDFHLGTPNHHESRKREDKIVAWLDQIFPTTHSLFLVGDIFDFWFEYKHVIPKGFMRLQSRLVLFREAGIPIYFFRGNHDMWMFDYFQKELGIEVFSDPHLFVMNNKRILVGHGDGLGPGDPVYKILKQVFRNKTCQSLFNFIHPSIGMGIANAWSKKSRASGSKKEDKYLGEGEWLLTYCKEQEKNTHHDYYIFGHRHLPLTLPVTAQATYVNLGDWIQYNTYAIFDGLSLRLLEWEK